MSKGGLPVSGAALLIMVLFWPDQENGARAVISFKLPLLCLMDVLGAFLYRGKPDWHNLLHLTPAVVAGILVASFIFVAEGSFSVSDKTQGFEKRWSGM